MRQVLEQRRPSKAPQVHLVPLVLMVHLVPLVLMVHLVLMVVRC
jgi:hypothetical protein